MQTITKLLQQEEMFSYLASVAVGVGLNVTIAVSLVMQGLSSALAIGQNPQAPILTLLLFLVYLVIGTIYSIVSSMRFHPKRIVRPMVMQAFTIPLVVVVIDAFYYDMTVVRSGSVLDWGILALVSLFMFILAMMILFTVAVIQTSVVRYLLGLNGSKDDVSVKSWLVQAELEKVLERINEDVLYALGIEQHDEDESGVVVFRTSRVLAQQFFLVACRDSSSQDRTQLVAISYELAFYGIVPSTPRMRLVEKGRLDQLRDALRGFTINESLEKPLLPASLVCYDRALRVTESRVLTIGKLPMRQLVTVVGIIAMMVIMTVLWYFALGVSTELYQTFLVFAGLAILTDIVPAIRRRKSTRTRHFSTGKLSQ